MALPPVAPLLAPPPTTRPAALSHRGRCAGPGLVPARIAPSPISRIRPTPPARTDHHQRHLRGPPVRSHLILGPPGVPRLRSGSDSWIKIRVCYILERARMPTVVTSHGKAGHHSGQ